MTASGRGVRRAVRRGLSALLKRPAMAWAKRSTFASFTSTVGRKGFKLKKPSCIMVVVDNEASGSGATVGGRDLSGAILRRGRPCSWREEQKGTTRSGRGRAIWQITWRVSVEAHSMIHCSIRHSPTLYSPDSLLLGSLGPRYLPRQHQLNHTSPPEVFRV